MSETRFGAGVVFERGRRSEHAVLDDPDWKALPLLKSLQSKAEEQLGSSGTGNHFVEWGTFRLYADDPELGLKAGEYLALLSHSGSRGVGFKIANTYTETARRMHPSLDKSVQHLAWLPLASGGGAHLRCARESLRSLQPDSFAGVAVGCGRSGLSRNFCYALQEEEYVQR